MVLTGINAALLDGLRSSERRLERRYGIRLQVDKVTPDGNNALCTAAQSRGRFLRSDHTSEEIVTKCHEALISLHHLGLSPLIGTIPRRSEHPFRKLDPNDPFRLRSALSAAGLGTTLPA